MSVDVGRLTAPERLLWSYGVRTPEHIDLEGIANHRGARVVYRHLDGCAARLVAAGGRAVISVGVDGYPGRQRFSLAHELAHLVCDCGRGSFRCANEDIGPQNAEAKSVEAYANNYASQLVLPDFLVEPWIRGRRATLDTAKDLAEEFGTSLTAAAIKLVKRSTVSACITCHSQTRLKWFQKNASMPFDFRVKSELHYDSDALSMVHGRGPSISRPAKQSADHWLQGPDAYRLNVESQSMKLPDGSVLTVVSILK